MFAITWNTPRRDGQTERDREGENVMNHHRYFGDNNGAMCLQEIIQLLCYHEIPRTGQNSSCLSSPEYFPASPASSGVTDKHRSVSITWHWMGGREVWEDTFSTEQTQIYTTTQTQQTPPDPLVRTAAITYRQIWVADGSRSAGNTVVANHL